MFNLDDKEMLRYRNDWLYRSVMVEGFRLNKTKEETLSILVEHLLQLKDEAFQEKIDEMMSSPIELIFTKK